MKLQFKHQPFQADAAVAVCDVFNGQPFRTTTYRRDLGDIVNTQIELEDESNVGFRNEPLIQALTNARILDNLHAVQRRNGLAPSETLSGPGINLTIEMETGTGKTYTYVKTMYELNKRYGWSKFIIVVPSVAIREGVYTSLNTTQEHFAGEYGKKIRFFIYSSDNLPNVDRFASDSAINVMIINMQAFNSSKNQRIIDKKLDSFRSRKPIDIIAKTNPILIIDEPQSVEGKQTKESLKKFCPLFTLRYSATHKEKYDMVYRLDAMDAYNQHLVKKIAALGITLTGSTATTGYVYLEGVDLYRDKAPTARLGFEVKGVSGTRTVVQKVKGGDDLFALSNGLDEYADRFRILPDGIDGRDNSVTFLNGLKLYAGQIQGNEQMVSLQRRIQIRETIRTHIRRERELYPKGIKVLSLFFIDEVKKYRDYDGDNDDGRNGEYAQMFEEEYRNVVSSLQREIGDEAYVDYLDKIDVTKTHQGYFSVDKKKGKKARFVESKIDRKTQTSDDVDAYDLIMKDKERLLSMKEDVRFIFSHSALREGWDNPNVFQICTLKKQSDSDIRSRQEIGRGLRLCVNQQGERMDESVLGRDVQNLNKLTVITDYSFADYVKQLQAGLAEVLADRPRKVDQQLFLNRVLVNANGEQVKVTPDLAAAIYEDLVSCGYVKRGQLTDQYYADKESGTVQVAEEVKDCTASVVKILSSIYDEHSMLPEDEHGNNVKAEVVGDKLHKPAFLALWERINHKSFYTVSFDTDELIQKSIQELDTHLEVTHLTIKKEYGEQTDKIASKEQLVQGEGFSKTSSDQEKAERVPLGSVRYDLVGKLVEETGLTRAAVAAILQGIAPQRFELFKVNPEEFILKAAKLINNQKATSIIEHIAYNRLDATYDTDIFTAANLRGKVGINAMPVKRSLYDYLIYDSNNEKKFADELDISEKVAIYVKLPGSFFISTPVGKYNPDWAIAFNEGSVKHVYFVAETKGNTDSMELRGVEDAKIVCARAHFAAISNESVIYDVVDSFEGLMNLVS
jgi:type III restriction enzyme